MKQILLTLSLCLVLSEWLTAETGAEHFGNWAEVLEASLVILNFQYDGREVYTTAFDYKNTHASKTLMMKMEQQVKTLRNVSIPKEKEAKKAFLINAYNFFTVYDVLKHYPVESMLKLGWKNERFNIGGKNYSLDGIEKGMLLPMGDARVHFAVNCASVGCPALQKALFSAKNLDSNLEKITEDSLASPVHFRTEKERIHVSELFFWYKDDFTKKNQKKVNFFLKTYVDNKYHSILETEKDLSKIVYNWDLNNKTNTISYLKSIDGVNYN